MNLYNVKGEVDCVLEFVIPTFEVDARVRLNIPDLALVEEVDFSDKVGFIGIDPSILDFSYPFDVMVEASGGFEAEDTVVELLEEEFGNEDCYFVGIPEQRDLLTVIVDRVDVKVESVKEVRR